MRVLIVGAGIGGLALASFLKQKNIPNLELEIIEKAPNWQNLGYAVGVWKNGREVMKKLGLVEKFDELGNAEQDYYLATAEGELTKLDYFEEFDRKFTPAFTHIHRADLHNILIDSIKDLPIKMDTHPKSITQKGKEVEVALSDGTTKTYDLVVGADGLKSQVRDLAFRGEYLHYVGWRAYFVWIEEKLPIPKGIFEMNEPGKFCLIFNDVGHKNLAVLATKADHRVWDDVADRLERVQKHFAGCTWMLPQIFEKISSTDLLPTDIAFVNMHNWVSGGVVLLGDAAHAMEQFAGMGVSMALEDAYVLGQEIDGVGRTNLPLALTNYQNRRFMRVRKAQSLTRGIWYRTKIEWFVWKLLGIKRHFTKGYEKILAEKI